MKTAMSLATLTLVVLAAGSAPAQTKPTDGKAIAAKAEAIVKALAAGNFAVVERQVAADSSELRPASELADAWKYATNDEGALQRIVGTKVLPNYGYPFVHVTTVFSKEKVLVVLSFNHKGLLETLNAVPCSAASDCLPG